MLFMGTEVVHNPVKEFVPLKEVKVGQEVCIAELNQLATVLSLPDKNGDVLVRAGIIKTKVPLKGLKQPEKLVKDPKPQTKAQQRYSRQRWHSFEWPRESRQRQNGVQSAGIDRVPGVASSTAPF